MSEDQIKKFNQYVERTIREDGTCKVAHQVTVDSFEGQRIACFEADCYRADDSIDGFIGWWEDDHSQMTHAATPYQVYCDMP